MKLLLHENLYVDTRHTDFLIFWYMYVCKGYDNNRIVMKTMVWKRINMTKFWGWQDIFYPIDTEMSNLLQTKENLANRAFRFFVNEVQY